MENLVHYTGTWDDYPDATLVWIVASGWGPVLSPTILAFEDAKIFCDLSEDWWGIGFDVTDKTWLLNKKGSTLENHLPATWEILTKGDLH